SRPLPEKVREKCLTSHFSWIACTVFPLDVRPGDWATPWLLPAGFSCAPLVLKGGVMEGKTILLIEDDPISLDWFGLILSEHGYTVTLARNGKAGVDFLENHGSHRLIILNMMMPVMDGVQGL